MIKDLTVRTYNSQWRDYIEKAGGPAVLIIDDVNNTESVWYEYCILYRAAASHVKIFRIKIYIDDSRKEIRDIIDRLSIDFLPLAIVYNNGKIIKRGNPKTELDSILISIGSIGDPATTEQYQVGDWVYFTRTMEEVAWRPGRFKPDGTSIPIKKKIISIVKSNDKIQYQVKGCHFDSSMIGKIVFNTYDEAANAMKQEGRS